MVRLAAGCYSTAFPRRGICNRKSFLCNVSDEKDKNAVLPVASHFFFHQRFFFYSITTIVTLRPIFLVGPETFLGLGARGLG